MPGPKILYTSGAVYAAVQQLFAASKGRRVAVAAFVGKDASDFLPNAAGVEVFCWPKQGSTSASGISKLQESGATVRFVDRLHSKVYWAEGRGAVVASANLSRSAMGSKSLIEAGVRLPDGALNIDKLLRELKPREVTPAELNGLRTSPDAASKGNRPANAGASFREWIRYGTASWKWSWFEHYVENATAKNAVKWAKEAYGVAEPEDSHFCRVGAVSPHEWLLVVRLGRNAAVRSARWLYVNNVVKVLPREKQLYDRRWPRQAVQAQSLRSCPTPPFQIDKRFVVGLKRAAAEWGSPRFRHQVNDRTPTGAFLKAIDRHWS
jgi:hypothetical protein